MPVGHQFAPVNQVRPVCSVSSIWFPCAVVCALVLVAAVLPGSSQAAPSLGLAEVKSRVAISNRQAEAATEQYNGAQEKLAAIEARLAQYQVTAQRQQARIASLQSALGAVASAEYRSGGVDQILALFFASDPEQFLQRAAILSQLSQQQIETMRSVERERLRLAQYHAAASQHHAELARTRADLYAYKAQIESKLQQAQRLLNSLSERERRRLAEAQRAKRAADRQRLARQTAAAAPRPAPTATPSPSPTRSPSPAPSPSTRAPSPAPNPPSPSPVSSAAEAAVAYAKAHVGDAYVWGAAGPDVFDCSGLTMMAWRQGGISLPHQSSQQYAASPHVARSGLQPGDLVFFYSPITHVGIYIGGGEMIHAANPTDGVRIDSIAAGSYWAGEYVGATRPG